MDFWASSSDIQARAIKIFAGTGARYVVAAIPSVPPTGWERISKTKYFLFRF